MIAHLHLSSFSHNKFKAQEEIMRLHTAALGGGGGIPAMFGYGIKVFVWKTLYVGSNERCSKP